MTAADLLSAETLLVLAAAAVAGLIRGFTGGAGANIVFTPALALVVGPREAVPTVLLINVLTSVQLFPQAARIARWGEIAPMAAAALAGIPLGVWVLLTVDEALMRRAVAAVALAFSVLLMTGWRYAGRRGRGATLGVGAVSGVLNGSASMGGPPVMLYLLSGPDPAAVLRAHFIVYATLLQVASLAVFALSGALGTGMLWRTALAVGPFALATWAGARLFRHASERAFRWIALWIMLLVSLAALVA